MGTRHLTAVILNGEPKIAQYGQWDGYPEGAGVDILGFLKGADLDKFKEAVSKTEFVPHEELVALGDKWLEVYPHHSRDISSDILQIVYDGTATKMRNSYDFAADSLFCEWAYVIDLDKNTLEIYSGFNKTPLTEGERFYNMPMPDDRNTEYYQCKHVKTFYLANLPDEATFKSQLEETEVED